MDIIFGNRRRYAIVNFIYFLVEVEVVLIFDFDNDVDNGVVRDIVLLSWQLCERV